jgi:eukaryotic-like serine/threonine-protein kinase
LMLTKKGQVKILDFGLARLASESQAELSKLAEATTDSEDPLHTRLGDVMGTPAYMAPEQLANASKADIRADIYALGSTLYYLLAEQPPYGLNAPRSRLLSKAKSRPVPLPSLCADLPPGLTEVVDKMMATDPDDRYQTPGEVVKALADYAKPAAVTSPPVKKAKEPAIIDVARNEESFLARCPFCMTRIRIPARALGASLPCPQCNCYFTSAPEDETSSDA